MGTFSIRFNGTIDRRYQSGYVDPNHGRFTFFKNVSWTTQDFILVKGLVTTFNSSAHRNKREQENIYVVVQIFPCDEKGINAHWEKDIEIKN